MSDVCGLKGHVFINVTVVEQLLDCYPAQCLRIYYKENVVKVDFYVSGRGTDFDGSKTNFQSRIIVSMWSIVVCDMNNSDSITIAFKLVFQHLELDFRDASLHRVDNFRFGVEISVFKWNIDIHRSR